MMPTRHPEQKIKVRVKKVSSAGHAEEDKQVESRAPPARASHQRYAQDTAIQNQADEKLRQPDSGTDALDVTLRSCRGHLGNKISLFCSAVKQSACQYVFKKKLIVLFLIM